ncbi:FAD-binding dehydrogenase [Agrococcus sp. ARC_14]|uniref:FAD-binding dehydrogenase n=1 Tax=Agrococcus sp. ARC_14 TaxID=2919927 RepID=UPI001F070C04|nr:FAD-binding dehydrogenase [Agrococcus sp. ARC_14]MCH1883451.1 FAD-binding dehydrogenase [Agrococcus sp. ARC_14]
MAAHDTDVIVIGSGLSGLVAACTALDRGRTVTIVEQEGPQSIGGQAFWSFGGLFLVDSPEQRRLGIEDSLELAWHDWEHTAGFDRDEDGSGEDLWARRWADAYLDFAHRDLRPWLRELGIRLFPVVGHAERGAHTEGGHGNTVPRFHIVWGTGPGIVAPFTRRLRDAVHDGSATLAFRHRVTALRTEGDRVVGVAGERLAPDLTVRGEPSSREVVGAFELRAESVVVATGGIGGELDRVRELWPASLGAPPTEAVRGVPMHVDGSGLELANDAGARLVNADRMWHYTEGIKNWDPIWPDHGIRILPGPSSLWLDHLGRRLPSPNYPGFDTLSTLAHLRSVKADHSWFVLTQSIVEKEFTLSGSEQNPDLTGKSLRTLAKRVLPGAPAPVQAFLDHGEDFIVAHSLTELLDGMEQLGRSADGSTIDRAAVVAAIEERDAAVVDPASTDPQAVEIRRAREYVGDRLLRTAAPHRILDEAHWPLIAVRLRTLTRKTLGGIQTDLDSRALGADGEPVPGLFAVGEAAGFGGGGVHGYRALEGTFLGGCLHTGLRAGRAA